ncbi:MAG: VOC family protein [Acidobacteria bacterium]|nr:VOC family protein [Acidobacteriota bacterium]
MSQSLGIIGYDSFHFIVNDLERSRRFYTQALGFTEVARASEAKVLRGGENASVFGAGQIRILVSSPVRGDSRAARYLRIHPDGISSLAFRVKDVEASWRFLEARGATFLSDIQTRESEHGRFRTFNIATPLDDVTFRFIQREGDYPAFAPDFEMVDGGVPAENPHGFATIDHVTSNAYTMLPVVNWYRDVLGFNHFWDVEFHTVDVDGGRRMTGSGLRSIVMADPESGIKFATNEPMRPFFRESQINRFCEDHHGAGVQLVAFLLKEIIPAVEKLREKGIAFLPAPPSYYDRLPKRLEENRISKVNEPVAELRKNHILVDGRDDKYMLQIFMVPGGDLYGDQKAGPFFYEVIQREGDKGFGYGNFRALFESIVESQRAASRSLEVFG